MDWKTGMYNLGVNFKDALMEVTEQHCAEKLRNAEKIDKKMI